MSLPYAEARNLSQVAREVPGVLQMHFHAIEFQPSILKVVPIPRDAYIPRIHSFRCSLLDLRPHRRPI